MIVLDTHVLVWEFLDDRRLGKKARHRIGRELAAGLARTSAFSFWEVAMLVDAGRLRLRTRVEDLRAQTLRAGVVELPVDGEIAMVAARLHGMHADPADRIIVATALVTGASLVTADPAMLAMKSGPPRMDAEA